MVCLYNLSVDTTATEPNPHAAAKYLQRTCITLPFAFITLFYISLACIFSVFTDRNIDLTGVNGLKLVQANVHSLTKSPSFFVIC